MTGVIYACRLQLVMPNVINHKLKELTMVLGPAPSILSSELVMMYSIFTGYNLLAAIYRTYCSLIAMENCCKVPSRFGSCVSGIIFVSFRAVRVPRFPHHMKKIVARKVGHGMGGARTLIPYWRYSRDDHSFTYVQSLM